jgi:hypothetical protein
MTGPGPGHNRGPAMDAGVGWRAHCWTVARQELLPHLPLEVVRLRVRRAREIGLDYRTYATVHATTGRDIVACLFSTNALRVLRPAQPLPEDRAGKLRDIRRCGRALLAHLPIDPERLAAEIAAAHGIRLDGAAPAPRFAAPWGEIRTGVLAALAPASLPPGGVMLIGDTASEREWVEAARLGSYLPAERYFAPGAP